MWELLVITVLISVGTAIGTYALAPKPPKPKPPRFQSPEAPTAEQGASIPIVFGTVVIKGPNVVWYGDLYYEPVWSAGGL